MKKVKIDGRFGPCDNANTSAGDLYFFAHWAPPAKAVMNIHRALALLMMTVPLCLNSVAQEKAALQPNPPVAKPPFINTPPAPPKPKLTDKQKLGLRLLGSALTEAMALQPDMRAYVEWQVARGYEKYDAPKADELLQEAFNSTTAITTAHSGDCIGRDEPCRVRNFMQLEIMRDMIQRSPDKIADILLKVDSTTKRRVDEELIDTYIKDKELDRAKELLDGFAGEDSYPYYEASSLMDALPNSRRQERVTVFVQALTNFQQFNTDLVPDQFDFPALLMRFWRQLPPALAMDAVDTILSKTKADDGADSKLPMAITTSKKGDIGFASAYELRLFELMPIIRELDSSRADALLRESAEVKVRLHDYPNGVFSMDEGFGKTFAENDGKFPEILNFGPTMFDPAEEREQAYILQQEARIDAEARQDPKQALAEAYSLPELTPNGHHPRLAALMDIVDRTVKKDPQVCRAALTEVRKRVGLLKPEWGIDFLLRVVDSYIQFGDQDDAIATLGEALKIVEQLHDRDADLDDPNQAFKVSWPSTQYWGRCLHIAVTISPAIVQEILSGIQDPEIKALEKVMYANGLLGVSLSPMKVTQIHKDGKYQSFYTR